MESKLSRHESPSKHRRSSSSTRRNSISTERDVPIKFISIQVEDEARDDEAINILVALIEKRDWKGVMDRIQMQEGINEAARVLPTNDYALHFLCKCGRDYKVSKYRSFRSSQTTESGSSADVRSRDNSSGTYTSTQSISTNALSAGSHDDSFPSPAVMEAVINAFPAAIKLPGEGDATPLHWAVRHRYPLELLNILIRTFPQALDTKDAGTRTPRNYANLTENPFYRTAIMRPTSCWLQHLQDEQVYETMNMDIVEMERQLQILCRALDDSLNEEELLQQRVLSLETEIETFGDLTRSRDFNDRAEEIREELDGSFGVIRGTLEGLVGQNFLKFAEEEKERSLLASFNTDVERIYNNANEGIEELRLDLNRIIQNRGSPTRCKR